MVKLVEVAPGKWRVDKPRPRPPRSSLPLPYVISDTMPPTEQVDGIFYESKSGFRKVGKALGLIEVGNEKFKPKTRASETRAAKDARRAAIKTALARSNL